MNVAVQGNNGILILGSMPIKLPKDMPYFKFTIVDDLKINKVIKTKQFKIQEGTLTEIISSSQIDIRFKSEHIKDHNTISFGIEEHEEVIRKGKIIIIDISGDLDPLIHLGMQPYCELNWDQ